MEGDSSEPEKTVIEVVKMLETAICKLLTTLPCSTVRDHLQRFGRLHLAVPTSSNSESDTG